MAPIYRRVAVVGAGPSGLAAVRALSDENVFDTIRVFERRDRVGGIWQEFQLALLHVQST
jgi:cation diffusion facilitator CzcD-associated flavoprotein CzcO